MMLNNTLVLPYVTYGILAWGNSGIGHMNRILKLQKKVLRIINNVDFHEHSNPLFYICNTLKVNDIYSLQLGSFMHQLKTQRLPKSICSMFTRNYDIHHYFTRQCHEFHRSYARITTSKATVKHEGPKLWNSVNSHLKTISSLSLFKQKYKNMMLDNYLQSN